MSTDAKTEDTPSKNTRSKKQALKNGVADATTSTANKGGVLATPNAESTGTKPKATPKSATKKKDEEETETAIVPSKSGSANFAKTLAKMSAQNEAEAKKRAEESKALAKRQKKLEKDQKKSEKDYKKLVKTVADNDKQTKAKFAAQSQQIKKVETDIAILNTNQKVADQAIMAVNKKTDDNSKWIADVENFALEAFKCLETVTGYHLALITIIGFSVYCVMVKLGAVSEIFHIHPRGHDLIQAALLYLLFIVAKILYRRFSKMKKKDEKDE